LRPARIRLDRAENCCSDEGRRGWSSWIEKVRGRIGPGAGMLVERVEWDQAMAQVEKLGIEGG